MTPADPSTLEDNILGTLAHDLKHEYTRVRRSAIERASEMLKSGQYSMQVVNLLQTVTVSDASQSVRDMAQQVLDQYKDISKSGQEPGFGMAAINTCCSLGHANTFDKSEICKNIGRYWRRSVVRDGQSLQEVVLTCKTCGEDLIVAIDCKDFD